MATATSGASTIAFRAMNTEWWITILRCADPSLLAVAEATAWAAEAAFSRFRADSLLSRLNRDRQLPNRSLVDVIGRALVLREATAGAFDVRVGPAVAAAGYDRSFERMAEGPLEPQVLLAPPVATLSVQADGEEVALTGIGGLDLGGIAKGWAIDRIAEAVEAAGYRDYVIDGGGDIYAGGRGADGEAWPIGVGDGLVAHLSNAAVATSSTEKRRWVTATGEAHHIIDPATGLPSAAAVTNAVIVAGDATTADALATAVVADPARGLQAVVALGGGALIEHDGMWSMTRGMERWIR